MMSRSLSGIVKQLCDNVADVDLHTVNIPSRMFEATFVRQLLLGTETAAAPEPLVQQYHQAHPRLRPPIEGRCLGDRNIYSAAATKYVTNLKNMLRIESERRIRSYINHFARLHGLSDKERIGMLYQVTGWGSVPRSVGAVFPARRVVAESVAVQRSVLGLGARMQFNRGWLRADACLAPLLRYSVFVNRCYERDNAKRFDVVPICSVRRHYISIDKHVLYGIMREAGATTSNEDTFYKEIDTHWRKAFAVDDLQGNGAEFGNLIETDGISVSVHFERLIEDVPALPAVAQGDGVAVDASDDTVVFGNDPGRINIYFMATVNSNGTVKSHTLTRRQYYTESGIVLANRNARNWNRGAKQALEALSGVTTKGASVTNHDAYLTVFHDHFDALWEEYSKPRWGRQRLRLYGGKKRTFDRFFNKLERDFPGRRVVVAYGSAKFAPGGRNELSVPAFGRPAGPEALPEPTTRAYKECARRVPTVAIDEFRTSKIDYMSDQLLHLVKVNGDARSLRGLLWSVERQCFVSRDLNAALNIRWCCIAKRPSVMTRSPDKTKLQQNVEKRIKRRR